MIWRLQPAIPGQNLTGSARFGVNRDYPHFKPPKQTDLPERRSTGSHHCMATRESKGEQGRGITVLDYYDTYAEFIAEHPTGSPGDFYGVDGDLYIWAQGHWKNLGRLIGAIAFEFELLMEQAGIEGATFEDFFREVVREALLEMNLSSSTEMEIDTWMTTHFSSFVSPLVTNWLNQNIGLFIDNQVATAVTNQLPVQLASHVSSWHEWQPI